MEDLPDLIAKLPVWLQYFLAFLVALATLFELQTRLKPIVGWPMARLWPNRQGWVADCPRDNPNYGDPNMAWDKRLGARWSQMRAMAVDDHFRLDISRPRVISRIRFQTEDPEGKDLRYPKRYRLDVQESADAPPQKCGDYEGPIDVSFGKPRRIQIIRVTILEPQTEGRNAIGLPGWSIYNINLTEVRLFRKWWRKEIK